MIEIFLKSDYFNAVLAWSAGVTYGSECPATYLRQMIQNVFTWIADSDGFANME